MKPLQLRKQLLLAESELNRAQWVEDWRAVSESGHLVYGSVKKIGSAALGAAMLVAGWNSIWRAKAAPPERKPSWWQILLKGIKLGATLWSEFRPPSKS